MDRFATVFASQQQLKEVRSYAAYACLSPPGKWLEAGENGFLTNQYLADICATAQARLFVSYATGGADWYPDHLSFMFSHRNPARTALLTANWDRPESLKASLDPFGCAYHCAQALDIVQAGEGGSVKISSAANTLTPLQLFQLDHSSSCVFVEESSFLKPLIFKAFSTLIHTIRGSRPSQCRMLGLIG